MSWCVLWSCLAAAPPPRAVPVPPEPEEPRKVEPVPLAPGGNRNLTISRSEQFRVSGAEMRVRTVVASLAEDAKDELLALVGGKDGWKVPVAVGLHEATPGAPMPPRQVVLQRVFRDSGVELRVDAHLGHGLDQESFKHAITAAMLYEWCMRGPEPPGEEAVLNVPPWVVEGLREAAAWRTNRGDRKLYEALYKHGGLYQPNDLFAVTEEKFEQLDGAMRATFRGSSGALVMALAEQPQGREGFRAFLTELAPYQGEMPALLRRHFPELNLSATSLAKWLALKLADMSAPDVTAVLSVPETEAALAEALQLNFRNADGKPQRRPVTDWEKLADLKEPERVAAVRQAQDSLVRLSYRCFPSYRPLLSEYQIVLSDIARDHRSDLPKRLADLARTRAEMLARANRAAAELDRFEINVARETSGLFESFLRIKARLKDNPTRRDDPLTVYLDRLDKIFAREGQGPPPGAIAGQLPPLMPGGSEVLPDLPGNLPEHLPIDQLPPPPPAPGGGGEVPPIDLPKP